MGINVLSLFDGISCGRVALERAGIKVDKYYASEIDKNAIKISEKNYSDIIRLGDVFDIDYSKLENIDIVIGGSPCTYWSIAQNTEKRETTCEGFGFELFEQFQKAIQKTNCKYFLYENNKSMSEQIKNEISKMLKCEPIFINSKLVSAQDRKRLYWTNIPNVILPQDKNILLQDILESGKVDRDKSLCITRRYAGFNGSQSYLCRRYFGKSFGQAVFEKSIEEIKTKYSENSYFESGEKNIRQLTIKECERLQTLPDNYTDNSGVSEQCRYECVGNGWTVDVIAHIFKNLL